MQMAIQYSGINYTELQVQCSACRLTLYESKKNRNARYWGAGEELSTAPALNESLYDQGLLLFLSQACTAGTLG